MNTILNFKNGLTVRELKELIKDWSETDEYTGEECEVWMETEKNRSNIVTCVSPLNKRFGESGAPSADILLSVVSVAITTHASAAEKVID